MAYTLYVKKVDTLSVVNEQTVLGLENYLKIVSASIGVRQQNKIPEKLALYLASCRSSHKDLTLYF